MYSESGKTTKAPKQILFDTAKRVFENAAYALLSEEAESVGEVMGVEIEFSGERYGRMRLLVPYELAITCAANMLGEEEHSAAAREYCEDALGELLNMITGSVLPRIFGSEVDLHIGSPRPTGVRSLPLPSACIETTLCVEGHKVTLCFENTRA